jgi:hypothetical protein
VLILWNQTFPRGTPAYPVKGKGRESKTYPGEGVGGRSGILLPVRATDASDYSKIYIYLGASRVALLLNITMASGSWPKTETLSQCFSLVRWFHEHGDAWSGTPTELAFTVATAGEGASWFRTSDELVKFIETNVDMLRDLGLAASVRSEAGRITIDLKSDNHGPLASSAASGELASQFAAMQANIERAATQAETFEPQPAPQRPPVDLGARLHNLIDLDGDETLAPSTTSVNTSVKLEDTRNQEQSASPVSKNSKSLLLGIGVVVVLAALMFAWSRPRAASTPQPSVAPVQPPPIQKVEKAETPAPTQTPPAAAVASPPQVVVAPAPTADNLDPKKRREFDSLLAEATTAQVAGPQYDLAMRYVQGVGIAKDNAQAYIWLSLAEANGSSEASSALQVVRPNLSPEELQRARVAIANAFIAGVCVPKNYLNAYRLLADAERSGSPEARDLKKGLEVKMPAWLILQAGGKPPVAEKR